MSKSTYVDGFVFLVPKRNRAAYKKMAQDGARMWKKFGALDYKECVGEDLKEKSEGGMKVSSFPKLTKPKAGEEVWFSYITYKNRAHRDAVNKKVMAHFDAMAKKDPKKFAKFKMPFDTSRMAMGGFSVVVSG